MHDSKSIIFLFQSKR